MMKHRIPLLLIGLSVVVALMTLGYVFYSTSPEGDNPIIAEQEAVATESAEASDTADTGQGGEPTSGSPTSGSPTSGSATSGAATSGSPPQNETQTTSEIEADIRFGTVAEGINQARIRPDGTAVIAGLAPPGSIVRLYEDGTIIGETMASDKGEWVIVPDAPLAQGAHLLYLEITPPDGEAQIEAMALAVNIAEDEAEPPLVALVPFTPEAGATQVLQDPDAVAGDIAEATESAESAEIAAAPEPPPQLPTVTIRTIETNPDGDIIVTGMANTGADSSGGEVFIRLDGQGIATTASSISRVVDGGYTAMMPIDLAGDRFRITVILQNDNGRKLAQARITLTRAKIDQALGDNALVVIHRGDALWRIAYRTYGEGLRFVDIYRQNRDQITDPDLIYPDQVLVVPNR